MKRKSVQAVDTQTKQTSAEILSEILLSKLSKSPELAAKQARLLEMLKKGKKMAPARTASNPIVAHMIELGTPVTIESYLSYAYTDPLPRPLRAEVRAEAEHAVREAAAILAEK